MEYLRAGLVSIAASAAFLLIDNQLLSLAPTYKWIGAAVVLVVAALLVGILPHRKGIKNSNRRQILSDNKFEGDLESEIEDTTLTGEEGADVLSRNKVFGDTKITIKNSKL